MYVMKCEQPICERLNCVYRTALRNLAEMTVRLNEYIHTVAL